MPSQSTIQRYRILGPVLIIASVFFFYLAYLGEVKARQLKTDGVVVPGVELRRFIQSSSKGSKSYHIVARYTPTTSPEIANKDFAVPRLFYERSGRGPGLRVRYFRADPSVAEIVGGEQSLAHTIWVGLAFLVLGGAISYAVYGNPPAWFSRAK